MGRSWLSALLVAALVVVGLGWWNTSRSRTDLARRLRETEKKVAQKVTPTPKTTPAKMSESKDPAPNGCASCHPAGQKYSLQNEIAGIKNHPKTTATTVKECMVCHAERVKPFKKVLHTAHLKGKVFPKEYGATNCIACHKMGADGSIGVKGYNI